MNKQTKIYEKQTMEKENLWIEQITVYCSFCVVEQFHKLNLLMRGYWFELTLIWKGGDHKGRGSIIIYTKEVDLLRKVL